MLSVGCRDSLFVAWHYACGSRWDTPFWHYARGGIARAREHPEAQTHLPDMQVYIEAGEYCPARNSPTWRTRSNGNARFSRC